MPSRLQSVVARFNVCVFRLSRFDATSLLFSWLGGFKVHQQMACLQSKPNYGGWRQVPQESFLHFNALFEHYLKTKHRKYHIYTVKLYYIQSLSIVYQDSKSTTTQFKRSGKHFSNKIHNFVKVNIPVIVNTVELPNNGQIGSRPFVLYIEVVPFRKLRQT